MNYKYNTWHMIGSKNVHFYYSKLLILRKGGHQYQSFTHKMFVCFGRFCFILFCFYFSIYLMTIAVCVCWKYLNFISYTLYHGSMFYQSYAVF